MTERNSFSTILRASSIVGGASVVNIVAGLVKMKVAAVLLGPAGVGLIGLYQSLMQTASSAAGLGMSTSGTRRIAAAVSSGGGDVALVRRALFWGMIVQATLGALFFWLASGLIAESFVADKDRLSEVAWLSLGVALMVGAGAQASLLTGLRRIGDIARIQIGGGLIGAVGGVVALLCFGQSGLLAMVLIAPLATFVLGHIYVMQLERPADRSSLTDVTREWGGMAQLGLAFMVSGLVTMAGHLAVRVLVQRELGADALGQFQAAWTIGMTYLTFVLGAMATDYYPRLSAVIADKDAVVRLVNEQTEVALLLCGPVLVAMLGCAPLVVWALYAEEFGPAVEILRWQLLGDILKVMSWPLGYVLLAAGSGKILVMTETIAIGVFVAGVAAGLPILGVSVTGIAFLAMYAVHLPLVWWFGGRTIGFRWSRSVAWQGLLTIGAALLVVIASRVSDGVGIAAGLVGGVTLGGLSVLRLASSANATQTKARIVRLAAKCRALFVRAK